ncbi:MAG: hypothetical protein NVSMB52_17600 [Chloroflexota bacterium]
MHRGVVYDKAWVGEMESSTPGVHVTFGTGTLPRENGFLGFGWATPDTRKWVDFRTLLADGQVDPVLKSLPSPSVSARLHQFMPNAISLSASGHKDYAAVGLGGGAADFELYGRFSQTKFFPSSVLGHAPPPLTTGERQRLTIPRPMPIGAEDDWAFRYANIVAGHVRPKLLMLNLPEMDTWGHWYGPADHAVFKKLMENIDRGIGRLEATYKRLGIYNRTDFIITADHAMMDSFPARNWGVVQDAAKAVGAQVARADGTGGAIWLKDPAQAKLVAQKLVDLQPAHVQAIFYRSGPGTNYGYVRESPVGWLSSRSVSVALQHLVDTTAGIHGPDLWVLYRENYTVLTLNVSGRWKGTHGGATWKVQHVPLIMAGPGIRAGVHSQFPARAIDIAPTMERLLGLPAIRRDGVILADAFTNQLPGEASPQKAIAPALAADVSALAMQSRIDDRAGLIWPGGLHYPIYPCAPITKLPCKTTPETATNH